MKRDAFQTEANTEVYQCFIFYFEVFTNLSHRTHLCSIIMHFLAICLRGTPKTTKIVIFLRVITCQGQFFPPLGLTDSLVHMHLLSLITNLIKLLNTEKIQWDKKMFSSGHFGF